LLATDEGTTVRADHVFRTIESHTGGNPTRVVLSGVPPLVGETMLERMLDLEHRLDWIRTALMFEPRGHSVMSGCVLQPPCDPRADVGVIFIEASGYLPMCGHDTIGLCTILVETGAVAVTEPYTDIRLDTPAGLVEARVRVSDGRAREVSFVNAPSFLLHRDVEITLPPFGRVVADIAYGGNFYAITEASQVGLNLDIDHAAEAIAIAKLLRPVFNRTVEVAHPTIPDIHGLTHIQYFGPPVSPEANARILVVIQPGGADRSPCGTGTCAKVATLVSKGELQIGEEFVHESITGALFRARAVTRVQIGGIAGVRVEVTGSAHLTGESTFVLDPEDPMRHGFLVA
jgi:proline racemase